MRAFMEKKFGRWASSEGIDTDTLCRAAQEAFAGQVEADLGGYLFKKRVARASGGKSGGYRTILGFRKGKEERIFFLYGFPKNVRASITGRERTALTMVAEALIGATDGQIDQLKTKGSLTELECGK